MAQIICIIGNKGGTGKTTISHMLCQGLGLLGKRSVCVLTDVGREPLDPHGRRYLLADARTREALVKVVAKIRELPGWIGVIDGGANRTEMDRKLYGIADLVVLPFRDSHEDMRTLVQDLSMFPRAHALPSQWPNNAWQRESAGRSMEQFLAGFRGRLLEPVPAVSASKLLLQHTLPATTPSILNNACRGIARQVLDLLQETYDAPVMEPEEADDGSELASPSPQCLPPCAPLYSGTTRH